MRTLTTRKPVGWVTRVAGLALAAGLGAGGPALAADAKATPAKTPSKACRGKAAELAKWLAAYAAAIDRQPAFIAVPEEVELVAIDRPTTSYDSGVVVLLSPHGISVEGEAIGDSREVLADRIRVSLARQQSLAKLTRQTAPQTVLLVVDRRTPWRRVVEAAGAATVAGAARLDLAFRSTHVPRVSAPGASAFDRKLKTIRQTTEPSARTAGISDMASALVAACAPLREPLASMAKRGGLAPGELTDALLACSCAADAASLKTLIWSVRPPEPGTLLSLGLAREASQGTPVAAAGELPWRTAHQLIVNAMARDAASPVRLEVRAGR